MTPAFTDTDQLPVDPAGGSVYEHGWQSWSPSGLYPIAGSGPRPAVSKHQMMGYRPEVAAPDRGFQGEGLVAIRPDADGPIHVFAGVGVEGPVPTIRAQLTGDRLTVSANGPVTTMTVDPGEAGMGGALDAWADALVSVALPIRRAPAMWCSWYGYGQDITKDALDTELTAMTRMELPVEVVQVDDGFQAAIGDWLTPSRGFDSVTGIAGQILDHGRRPGLWLAPFFAAQSSAIVAEHPDWWVTDHRDFVHWNSKMRILDLTHPGAVEHLAQTVATLARAGFDYFKLDFLFAGLLPGRRHRDIDMTMAYRDGIAVMREAAGTGVTFLGCGAPMLPSIGLFEIMRVGPDVTARFEEPSGELSSPSMRGALLTSRARTFTHARWWINDPDCLIANPSVERRELWAEHVTNVGGQVASGDRLNDLDDWGIKTTQRLLSQVATPAVRHWICDPADSEQGRIAP